MTFKGREQDDTIQVVMSKEAAAMICRLAPQVDIIYGPPDTQVEDELPTYFLWPTREVMEQVMRG